MSLPRDRNGDGHATDAQWAAAQRWSRQYRKQHRHENRQDRWDRWEISNEQERFGKS